MKTFTKIIRGLSVAIIVSCLAFTYSISTSNAGGDRVMICHCHNGVCDVDIAIGEAALAVHLDHGDTAGPCE